MNKPWFAPDYNHLRFCDVYPDLDKFLYDYQTNVGVYFYKNTAPITNDGAKTLYFLLYAKYGNTPIINFDVNQWKFKIFSIVFAHGPLWEKKLGIQTALNNLTEDEIRLGAKQVYNHAFNPSSTPSTDTLEEVNYINDQNVASHKKGVIDAYAYLWENLHASATDEFLRKFKDCFSSIVAPDGFTPFYIEDEVIWHNN